MAAKINDNYISILNHKITLNDMKDEMYYMFNIAHCNNPDIADSIYFSKLNQEDKDIFNNFKEQKLYDIANISDYKKPFFFNNITKYKSYNNKIYCIPLKLENNNFNNLTCIDDIMLNFNIFYKTLKFKIKQEKITKNIYNDLQIYNKKLIDLDKAVFNINIKLQSQDKIVYNLCNIVEQKYIQLDNIDKKRNIYLILFVIISSAFNLIISYKMI